ncbi:MAG: calcium-binding protein [Acidimicrobiales bacterium]
MATATCSEHPHTSRHRGVILGILTTLLAVAALVAATTTSGAQPANPLTGVWYAVAEDGSHPTTIVFGEGRANAMPFIVVDTITVGCTGGPEVLVGTASFAGNEVRFRDATRYCADGSSFLNGPYEFPYEAGVLTDAVPGGVRTTYQKICPNETRGDFLDSVIGYQFGTGGPDDLVGTAGPDVIDALAGNDTVRAGNGNDIICAGPGGDVVRGGGGIDIIWGDGGGDLLIGQADIDVIYGGPGNDRIRGNGGADVLFGAAGRDNVRGGGGNDVLDGGRGADTLLGNRGRDTADGGGGRDRCVAEVETRCER